MKRKDIEVFSRQGKELFNLALKLDSRAKLDEIRGRKQRPVISQVRHDAIMALGSVNAM